MKRVLVNDGFRSKLDELRTQVELCDGDGRVMGYFIPAVDDPALSDRIAAKISDEELERRKREPGGKTTAEVLAALRGK